MPFLCRFFSAKEYFRNTIDSDRVGHFVGPDLGPQSLAKVNSKGQNYHKLRKEIIHIKTFSHFYIDMYHILHDKHFVIFINLFGPAHEILQQALIAGGAMKALRQACTNAQTC